MGWDKVSKIKFTILHIIEWIFAVLGLLMTLSVLVYGIEGIKSGIILLISAFVISPLFEKISFLKINLKKKILIQFILSFILLCIGVYFIPATDKPSESKSSDIVVSSTTSPKVTTLTTTTTSVTTTTSKLTTTSSSTTKKITFSTQTTTTTTTTTILTTTTQSNKEKALNTAKDCIKEDAYAYSELINLLELTGYSHDEATYAVDNCGADWNKEAIEKTESILSMGDFSKEYVIGILTDEGFTDEQSEYAVSQFDLKSENESVVVPSVEEIQQEPEVLHFVLNLETNCVHINQYCSAAQKITSENYSEIDIPESDLASYENIYWACGKCSRRYTDILPKF